MMKMISGTKMNKMFRIGLALLLTTALFDAFPLPAAPAGKGGEGIGGAVARVYVAKKKEEYKRHTRELKAMLGLLGVPQEAKKVTLPEPDRLVITVNRAPVPPVFIPAKSFFQVKTIQPRKTVATTEYLNAIAAGPLTANAFGLPQHFALEARGFIITPERRVCAAEESSCIENPSYPGRGFSFPIAKPRRFSVQTDTPINGPDVDLTGLLRQGKVTEGNLRIIGIDRPGYIVDSGGFKAGPGREDPEAGAGLRHASYATWNIRAGKRALPHAQMLNSAEFHRILKASRFLDPDHCLDNIYTDKTARRTILVPVPPKIMKLRDAEIAGKYTTEPRLDYFFPMGGQITDRLDIFTYRAKPPSCPIRPGAVVWHAEGSGPFTVANGQIFAVGNWVGKSTITATLLSPSGVPVPSFARSVDLTASSMEMVLDAPQDLFFTGTGRDGGHPRRLSLGKEYTVRMVVRKAAETDMRPYHVRWEQRGEDINQGSESAPMHIPINIRPAESRFTCKGNVCTATAKVSLPEPSAETTPGKLAIHGSQNIGEIRSYLVGRGHTDTGPAFLITVASPAVTHVALRGGYGDGFDANSGPLDLFIGSPVGPRLFADVDSRLKKGGVRRETVKLPVRWIRVQQDKGLGLTRSGSRIVPAGNTPGKAKIRAVIRKEDTDKTRVSVAFKDGKDVMESDPLTITINRPYLIRGSNGASYRLVVDGPANMSRYSARWKVFVEGRDKSFVNGFNYKAGEDKPSSSIDLASGMQGDRWGGTALESVEILNKNKQVVARLGGKMPVISPGISLQASGGAFVQGKEQKITATITRLPLALAKRTVVKWYFSGILPIFYDYIGRETKQLNSMESRLKIAGNGYKSSIVVNYPEDLATAGKKPMIRTELILKERAAEDGKK